MAQACRGDGPRDRVDRVDRGGTEAAPLVDPAGSVQGRVDTLPSSP